MWAPVKKYVENDIGVNPEKENVYFDIFNIDEMQKVLNLQHKINEFQKKNGATKLFSVLFLVDDFIDQASFAKHNNLLSALYQSKTLWSEYNKLITKIQRTKNNY